MRCTKEKRNKKRNKGRIIRCSVALLLTIYIVCCRFFDGLGEWYARSLYPLLSSMLHVISGWLPYSCEEILVLISFTGLISFLIWSYKKKHPISDTLLYLGEGILWIYIWFYLGWGINYFRASYFERANIQPATYENQNFRSFLKYYTDRLNDSYRLTFSAYTGMDRMALEKEAIRQPNTVEKQVWQNQLQNIFYTFPGHYGLCRTQTEVRPKRLLFNTLYSAVGVMGYMGPFFCEMQLNEELTAGQYPFTYAHELSHVLGISSEAEANYWAYRSCTLSSTPAIRYSGYLGILPYVNSSARLLLTEDEFSQWITTIHPEILQQTQIRYEYWQKRYSPIIGKVQDLFYNWYLQGNKIASGTKNYGEVMSMILADWNNHQ